MAFTFHVNPHHIQHPMHGWLTPELVANHSDDCECGLSLKSLVGENLGTAGSFGHLCKCSTPCPSDSCHPDPDFNHWVEVDISTGLIGYTRLTPEEQSQEDAEDAEYWKERNAKEAETAVKETEAQERIKVLQKRAKEDEVFKTLLKHLGILND